MSLHGLDVNQMDSLTNLGDQNHWSNTSILPRQELRQDNKIISAHRCQLHIESVLVVIGLILFVMTDQLLGVPLFAHQVVIDEVCKSLGVRPVVEMEVEALAVVFVLNVDHLVSCVVLKDHLFKEEEGSLMVDFLSDLDLTLPQMGSVCLFTLLALQV